jgi:hypothetical protein
MNTKLLAAATIATFTSLVGATQAFDLQAGGQPQLKVTKLQMGIKSPATNVCPAEAKLMAWVFTNKAGTVPIFIARDGGGVSGPFLVEAKATGNGGFMGTYSRTLQIHQPIDADYRASAPQHKQLSNWVPLKASCKIGLGGNGLIGN